MKGFMHIVEIMLVVILIFFVFAQFSSIPRISTEWSDVKLKLMGSDLLSSLELQGTDWFSESELAERFNRTMPVNMIYNLRLENVIKPRIKIGCFCDDAELNDLVSILSPGWFVINGENVSFEVMQVENITGVFSLDFDVSFFPEYVNLETQEIPLRNFLRYDKGVVEIADLTNMDSVQEEIFGLGSSGLTPNSNVITFNSESEVVDNEIYNVRKYFYHIPLFYENFESLFQWQTNSGNPLLTEFGDGNSVKLQGTDCGTTNTWIYTTYDQFYEGEINLDVYVESGVFYLNFRLDPSTNQSYLASFSANSSLGYDAFYRQSGSTLTYIGSDQSHLTSDNEWHRMKIVVKDGEFGLYNDGELVAYASDSTYNSPGSVGMFHICGEVYADNVRTTFEKDHEFQNFLGANENVTQFDYEEEKIVLLQDSGVSASIVNYRIQEGKGRAVWLSGGGGVTEERKTLVKSLMAWAAGDEYDILKGDVRNPVVIPFYKTYSKDMLQEVRIVLSLGYLY